MNMIALRSAGEVHSSRLAEQGKNAESTATNNNSQRAKRLNEQKPNRARREFARYRVPSIGVKSLLHDYDITYSISLYGIGLGVNITGLTGLKCLTCSWTMCRSATSSS